MVSSGVELKPRSVWGLLSQSLAIYLRNFGTLFGISAAVYLPMSVLALGSVAAYAATFLPALLPLLAESPFPLPSEPGNLTLGLVAFYCLQGLILLWAILVPLGEGAAAYAVVERVLGRAPGIRASFSAAGKRFLDLWLSRVIHDVVLGVLSTVASVGIAFISLVFVDGGGEGDFGVLAAVGIAAALVGLVAMVGLIAIALLWAFRAQAVVAEGADAIQALKRSAALAKGNLMRLVGRFLAIGLIQGVILGGLAAVVGGIIALSVFAAPSAANIAIGTVGATVVLYGVFLLANQFLLPWYAGFVTLNYLDLRARKGDLPLGSPASTSRAIEPMPSGAQAAPAVGISAQPVALRGWEGVNPDTLPPGQRASYLFERIRAEGESPRLLNDLGLAFMEVGDVAGAMEVLKRARALDPNDADIAFNLALAYRQRRDLESARQMMREYFRLETNADDLARVRSSPFLRDILPE